VSYDYQGIPTLFEVCMFTFLGELFDDSFFSLKSSTVQDEGKLGVKVVVGFPFGSIFVVRVHNTTP